MKHVTKRLRPGFWKVKECKGRCVAFDQRTGRTVRARDREHAAEIARANNERELSGCCRNFS